MACHIYQVTCVTCHSLNIGCHVSNEGSRWVRPLCAFYNPDPTASPLHPMTSSPSSSCLPISRSTIVPWAKKPIDPRRMTMKQWHGVVGERVEAVLLGWS
ncbi:B-box zinc finger family protein [Musa troglodytarum]|uniref:B-box zinc finger family protein n=1 Tax=Musa troglodytarum TaxID=320322 RepID=A0A9E7FLD0_9LILI|nr:B-box zinc finger family protein [Musa troglodytarum]